MSRLAIIGASGHGKVVADIAETCGWTSIDFFDDAEMEVTAYNGNWPIVGNLFDAICLASKYDGVIVAIGNNIIRSKICDDLFSKKLNLVTLVHPFSMVSRYAQLGHGSVVAAGAVINAYAVIGRGAIVNTGASIDHDCWLGDYVHISPGAHLAGSVKVGCKTWIGIGSSIKQRTVIGSEVTVGAGAVVINDVADKKTVVGVPARPLE